MLDFQRDVWVMLHATQGGTCLILGDDQELMAEAAKAAKRRLGCSIHRRAPSSRLHPAHCPSCWVQSSSQQQCKMGHAASLLPLCGHHAHGTWVPGYHLTSLQTNRLHIACCRLLGLNGIQSVHSRHRNLCNLAIETLPEADVAFLCAGRRATYSASSSRSRWRTAASRLCSCYRTSTL
jgi:hypothetical protein